MKAKKLTSILVLLLFALITQAQVKYEFAVIEYNTFESKLFISKDGVDFSNEKVEINSGSNANPLLNRVKEWQDKGWEVMSFNTFLAGDKPLQNNKIHLAYLRKKKQ